MPQALHSRPMHKAITAIRRPRIAPLSLPRTQARCHLCGGAMELSPNATRRQVHINGVRSASSVREARTVSGQRAQASMTRTDRPWRRPGAAAYALRRLPGLLRPPVHVYEPSPGSLTVLRDLPVTVRDGTVL